MTAINTPYATLSFANIFTPRPRAEGGSSRLLLLADLRSRRSRRAPPTRRFRTPASRRRARSSATTSISRQLNMPFRDAGEKSYDGYHAGHTFISPWSKNKPGVVDTNRQDILVPEEVWSGQLVRANVVPFAWTHTGAQGRVVRVEPPPDHPVRGPRAARRPPFGGLCV